MRIYPNESSLKKHSAVWMLVEHLKESSPQLSLDDAVAFVSFPLFREDDRLLVADLVIISPFHGVILVSSPESDVNRAYSRSDGAFSQVFSRLVRYPKLRSGRAGLKFSLDSVLWLPDGDASEHLLVGLPAFDGFLRDLALPNRLDAEVFDELVSTLDGSKALLRPKDREVASFPPLSKVSVIAKLEEEIRRFDRDQRVAYMTEATGPQRIQGLAGSGKTVVLALKAALTAVREPDARIAVTFYTKSLYQHIRHLITRFYRMHEDKDPDWKKIQVLHAWGGAAADGLYYQTAKRFGHQALDFQQAKLISSRRPFAAACKPLLDDGRVADSFDYVFVDEAQDFPPEFMRLALKLAVDEKLVIAYDIFQTIFDVDVPTAETLFGVNELGAPLVSFEEDIVLHKCYRNPREILVCAHAIGFGVYGERLVQLLESADHWKDFGYDIREELVPGRPVEVFRPQENSPSSISSSASIDQIIQCEVFQSPANEVASVVARIANDISVEGVPPEDILVICADDRNAAAYLTAISRALGERAIRSNNMHARSYGIPDFQEDGAVTLSTVYKAKGNEAYCVYIVGIDALFDSPGPRNRNCAFTAMTRAKGWLSISGVGSAAERFNRELIAAKSAFPNLRFVQPSSESFVFMKRDLSIVDPTVVEGEIELLGSNIDPVEFERILRKKLRQVQAMQRSRKRLN